MIDNHRVTSVEWTVRCAVYNQRFVLNPHIGVPTGFELVHNLSRSRVLHLPWGRNTQAVAVCYDDRMTPERHFDFTKQEVVGPTAQGRYPDEAE